MPGKKRPTSAKTSALSKRHKSGGGSAASSSNSNNKRPFNAQPVERLERPKPSTSAFASVPDRGGKGGKYKALDGVKKDKKGKGPAFITVPGMKPDKRGDSSNEEEEEMEENSESDEESEGDGMEVDQDLQDGEGVEFLTKLDQKGISA